MGQTDFKSIQPVPTSADFLDIVLSRTQRKTPTVIHKGYAITRIRSFYLRKVRYTQQTFDEKLGAILTDFPRLEDIHPFYADLMNVLYDRDHYKLALGQIRTAKHLIDNVASEYLKLIKYGDSLFRCKQLKRAALGRMATIMRRQKDSLAYLEQVRQHVSRLPSIDPNTRTLLLCGYPNVGKSSFMNKVTRANVDVQPYAFTTKSLFVGHMDYRYLRWQVIDTPGILDHPLDERNTIEMQSITAMAHIRASILYFVDLSEQCGYSIAQQVALFHSIKPLFANRPIVLVINKVDLCRPEDISESDRVLWQSILDVPGVDVAQTSCVTEEGIMAVRNLACEKLMAVRVEAKLHGPRIRDVLHRLHLTTPQARDDRLRPAFIPQAVLDRRSSKRAEAARPLARDIEVAGGGAGVYNVDLRSGYILNDDSWRYDAIPEIVDGKNIADFIDPDIEERLAHLEAEEEQLDAAGHYSLEAEATEADRALQKASEETRNRRKLAIIAHRAATQNNTRVVHPMRIAKRKRAVPSNENADDMMAMQDEPMRKKAAMTRSISRSMSRARSAPPARDRSTFGLRDDAQRDLVEKDKRFAQRQRNLHAKRGEADREILVTLPRHLFSGKRKSGTHDRR